MTDILLEKRGSTAIITFNRESKLNALDQHLYYKLGVMLNDIANMDDIYITVLTGKGRYFSAYVLLLFTTSRKLIEAEEQTSTSSDKPPQQPPTSTKSTSEDS